MYASYLLRDTHYVIVSVGGYVACLMTKYALYYATQHPKLQSQIDLRNSYVQFYRPTFASAPLRMTLREVNIGKAQSTLRVESFQNEKLAVSVDIAYVQTTPG